MPDNTPEDVFPFAEDAEQADEEPEFTPEEIRAKLKHDIAFDFNTVIREVLSVVQDRDCSNPDTYARVRHLILDKLNGLRRTNETYIDAYDIVSRGRQQIVFPMNQGGGMVMVDEEDLSVAPE